MLGCWAVFRVLTRSPSAFLCAVDYVLVLATCLALPALVCGPGFYHSNSAPVAVAGSAVISFAVSLPVRISLAMTAGIAVAFACGAAKAMGWSDVASIFNLYYFAAQWVVSAAIRLMTLRVADAVDESRNRRETAELDRQVLSAVREYDREQLRLLHDTVASTLMMVGAGVAIPRDRLAAQARRDLELIEQRSPPLARLDLVDLLHQNDPYVRTPVHYTGLDRLPLHGVVAEAVASAAREAFNNVDRHAGATVVIVDVHLDHLTISDNGNGFDQSSPVRGHGIEASILARMEGAGGHARVSSRPSAGTTVELRWERTHEAGVPTVDPDRLINRVRVSYGLALTVYAIANLAMMAPMAFDATDRRGAQIALTFAAAVSTLWAVPTVLKRRRWPTAPAVAILFIVALAQPALLPPNDLGAQPHWAQATIGWCLLPLLLLVPPRLGATALIACWVIPAIYLLVRDPSAHTAVNIGYGTGSILGVQLAALMFNDLIARGAASARVETEARAHLLATQRIGATLQAEYRNRYADLLGKLRPLLQALSSRTPIDTGTRRQAQNEYRILRSLFDQAATYDHPLLARVRPLIDAAESRGVEVSLHVEPNLPIVDDASTDRLAGLVGVALSVAMTSARLTLSGIVAGIEISVLLTGLAQGDTLEKLVSACDHRAKLTLVDDIAWLTLEHHTEGDDYSDTAGPRVAGSGRR